MDWILKYWIQELFAVIIAVLTWCVRKLRKKKTEYDVLREGILVPTLPPGDTGVTWSGFSSVSITPRWFKI